MPSENRSLRRCAHTAVPCPPAPPRPWLGQGGRFITATLFFFPGDRYANEIRLSPGAGEPRRTPDVAPATGFSASRRHRRRGTAPGARGGFPVGFLAAWSSPSPQAGGPAGAVAAGGGLTGGFPVLPTPLPLFPKVRRRRCRRPPPPLPFPPFRRALAATFGNPARGGEPRAGPASAPVLLGQGGGVLDRCPPRPSTTVPPCGSRLRRRLREPVPVSSATHGLLISAGPR